MISVARPNRILLSASLALLLTSVIGCSSGSVGSAATTSAASTSTVSKSQVTTAEPQTVTTGAATIASLARPTLPDGTTPTVAVFPDFSAATFSRPTVIDNNWLPLTPGGRLVLSGTTVDAGAEVSHQLRYVVTGLTKKILGVATVVVFIEDYSNDQLVEAEVAFFAQDDGGNVWFFGEHPEEYEDETFVAAPTWIAGVDGALSGIAMYADPQPTTPAYFQGWGPAVEWSDFATVESTGNEVCVESGCFPGSITIAESSLGESGIAQVKSYGPGVGTLRVDFRGQDATQERLEAVDVTPLPVSDLNKFNALAKGLEANAYAISPKVYGTTAPMVASG
jgi:hypothetical protein